MIKYLLQVVFLSLSFCSKGQSIDSAWLRNEYLPKFYVDTGTYLTQAQFVDQNGTRRTLADYRGKLIYLDLWATWCGNCLEKFPYQEQLQKRLKILNLDTAILFINVNIDQRTNTWKTSLRKYKPSGINLHTGDTSLITTWNIKSLPAFILLDSSGKVLGKDITGPDEASIDWILYCATKGISPVESIWRQHVQNKLMERHRTSSAFSDPEYAEWYNSLLPAFLEYNKWRQERQKNRR